MKVSPKTRTTKEPMGTQRLRGFRVFRPFWQRFRVLGFIPAQKGLGLQKGCRIQGSGFGARILY